MRRDLGNANWPENLSPLRTLASSAACPGKTFSSVNRTPGNIERSSTHRPHVYLAEGLISSTMVEALVEVVMICDSGKSCRPSTLIGLGCWKDSNTLTTERREPAEGTSDALILCPIATNGAEDPFLL